MGTEVERRAPLLLDLVEAVVEGAGLRGWRALLLQIDRGREGNYGYRAVVGTADEAVQAWRLLLPRGGRAGALGGVALGDGLPPPRSG